MLTIRWINGSDVAFSDRLLSFSTFSQTTGTWRSKIWHFLCGISNGLAFKFFYIFSLKNKKGGEGVYWMQTWAWIWAQESLWLSFLTVWLYSQGLHVGRRWSSIALHHLSLPIWLLSEVLWEISAFFSISLGHTRPWGGQRDWLNVISRYFCPDLDLWTQIGVAIF